MKKRVFFLLIQFAVLVLLFALWKPIFMLYNQSGPLAFTDYLQVIWHGLSLDATVAGYLSVIPLLMLIVSIWFPALSLRKWLLPYWSLIGLLVAIGLVVDTALYEFWGFKLDATIFNYLDSPSEAMASVSVGFVILRVSVIFLLAVLTSVLLIRLTPHNFSPVKHRILDTVSALLIGGCLFIIIRGGVSESTANIGQVYFSQHQFLNHAAVNPLFSLISSAGKSERFEDKYDFFPEEKRASLFDGLYPVASSDSATTHLLKTERPNILIIVLEGFGAVFTESLGGAKGASPNFDRIAREGVFFTQFYANSFRTDRGTICIFSGYPGLPQTSVMKIPAKSRTLPSIAASLSAAGYRTDFLYGGDINFTNMKSYLLGSGYQQITADTDFTLAEQRSNAWGVNDDITFDHLYKVIVNRTDSQPWHTAFLTLSSHEPFEVPFQRFPDDKRLNAFAYTDACLGKFIDQLKQTPVWENLLVICLPDHSCDYPEGKIVGRTSPDFYHIPMVWTGGAIKKPMVVDKLASQTDLPATLLPQLGLSADGFDFSRNILGSSYTYPFAFYTFNDGLGFIDSTGATVFSNESGKIIAEYPSADTLRLQRGQAILQTVFDDLGAR